MKLSNLLTKYAKEDKDTLELPCIIFGCDVKDLPKSELQKYRDVAKNAGYDCLIKLDVRESLIVFGRIPT